MKNQTPTTPDTKSGTAASYTAERDRVRKILDKLEVFNESIAIEKMVAQESGILMPVVEAPIEIIQHFNRGAMMDAFKKTKFFVYQGAVICEEGTREEVENELELSHKENPDEHMARLPKENQVQTTPRFKRVTTPPY